MCRQRATYRLTAPEAADDAACLLGIDLSGDRLFGGIGLKLFELQFRLFKQLAARSDEAP
jgi:hypothetical protein